MSKDSLEELLKFLQVTDSEKSPDLVSRKSILSDYYIQNKIRDGIDRVPNYVIYYNYKEKYGGVLSKIEFFRQFKKDFNQVRTGKQRCYLLDKSSFDMSRDAILEAKFLCNGKK